MLFPLYDRLGRKRLPIVTIALIAVNIAAFVASIRGGPLGLIETVYRHGFVPKRFTEIGRPEPVIVQERLPDDRRVSVRLGTAPPAVYPTLVTMMFLHGGWLHLISNMWMLWVFGDNVEDRFGRLVYLLFYLVGGLLAVLAQWASDPGAVKPVIGASGAVAAVLGAYTVSFPSSKVRTLLFVGIPLLLDVPAAIVLCMWFLLQMLDVVQGIVAPQVDMSVAVWAHVGGFVAGLMLAPLAAIGSAPPGEDWRRENTELFA